MNRIFVVGASQGGVQALCRLIGGLPPRFRAPILVVIHIGASPSLLPSILNDLHGPPAAHARHGETLEEGRIYIAPPDHHLLLVDGRLELSRGPRENFARPALDPLFRSAAESFGPAVVGVVLTGALNDGTSGLFEIKRRGGVAVVQDPLEAESPSMPRSALENVAVDFRCALAEIPLLMARLEEEEVGKPPSRPRVGGKHMDASEGAFLAPPAQTCPECGGAMYEEAQGTLVRFRCHIGHVMTGEVLAAAQVALLEKDVGVVLRTLNERTELCRRIGSTCAARGDRTAEKVWLAAADQAARSERTIRSLSETQWTRPEERPEPSEAARTPLRADISPGSRRLPRG